MYNATSPQSCQSITTSKLWWKSTFSGLLQSFECFFLKKLFTHGFEEMGYTRFLTWERINPFTESVSQSLKMAMLMFKLRSACTYFFKICLCFSRGIKSRITFVIKLLYIKENALIYWSRYCSVWLSIHLRWWCCCCMWRAKPTEMFSVSVC